MFPSFQMMPEPSMLSWLTVGLAMFVSFIARYLYVRVGVKVLIALALVILMYPTTTYSMIAMPGACGTACVNSYRNWGPSWYGPGVYMYPFYRPMWNPMPYPMLPPLMGGTCWNCAYAPTPSIYWGAGGVIY